MDIRSFDPADASESSFMVMAAFHAAVAPHYRQAGIDAFAAYADAVSLTRRQRAGHRTWVAQDEGRIVGLVELRLPAHVAMLFAESLTVSVTVVEPRPTSVPAAGLCVMVRAEQSVATTPPVKSGTTA